jgi:hypothetical protein
MLEAVENVFGDSGLTLLRGKNLDCPVRSDRKRIGNFATLIARNPIPDHHSNIWNNRHGPSPEAEAWRWG